MARDRAERVAVTEAAFRIANERMSRWEERQDGEAASYFCECGKDGCREELRPTPEEYEAVRAHVRHFMVRHDHVIGDLETEIERHDRYSVVEKPPYLQGLLDDTDPRGEPRGAANDEASELADQIGRAESG